MKNTKRKRTLRETKVGKWLFGEPDLQSVLQGILVGAALCALVLAIFGGIKTPSEGKVLEAFVALPMEQQVGLLNGSLETEITNLKKANAELVAKVEQLTVGSRTPHERGDENEAALTVNDATNERGDKNDTATALVTHDTTGDLSDGPELNSAALCGTDKDEATALAVTAGDAVYTYATIDSIPDELPEDAGYVKVFVDKGCNWGFGERVLKTFHHPITGATVTLAVPYIEDVTELCVSKGYSMISVLVEKPHRDLASASYFAFVPEEGPMLSIALDGDGDINAPIFSWEIGAKMSAEKVDGLYVSTSFSDSSYDFWGGSGSDASTFALDALTVKDIYTVRAKNEKASVERNIENYATWWDNNRYDMALTLGCFSGDRTQFYLASYMKLYGAELVNENDDYCGYKLTNGTVIELVRSGDSASLLVNGERRSYYSTYTQPLPYRVMRFLGSVRVSGDLMLDRDRMEVLIGTVLMSKKPV